MRYCGCLFSIVPGWLFSNSHAVFPLFCIVVAIDILVNGWMLRKESFALILNLGFVLSPVKSCEVTVYAQCPSASWPWGKTAGAVIDNHPIPR